MPDRNEGVIIPCHTADDKRIQVWDSTTRQANRTVKIGRYDSPWHCIVCAGHIILTGECEEGHNVYNMNGEYVRKLDESLYVPFATSGHHLYSCSLQVINDVGTRLVSETDVVSGDITCSIDLYNDGLPYAPNQLLVGS